LLWRPPPSAALRSAVCSMRAGEGTAQLYFSRLDPGSQIHSRRYLLTLSLGALGVVYGDIGTSPLYALRECFHMEHGVAISHDNILGILSLIFWSLVIVISVKYLAFVMRADNRGEGGILALMALAGARGGGLGRAVLVALGLF